MSEMQIFYGTFQKSNIVLEEGEDDFDASERLGINLVTVDGQLYEYESLKELDEYGFSLLIEPSDKPRAICHWYNGGASKSEVIASVIREQLQKEKET